MKKKLAIALSWLAVFSPPFLPSPAYAVAVATLKECGIPIEQRWTKQLSKAYARALIAEHYPEWNRSEFKALSKLWGKESAWNHYAANPESTAYGIPQILDMNPETKPTEQIKLGLEYIAHRYNKPSVAWNHWQKNKWY